MTLIRTNNLRGPGDWVFNAWQQAQTIPGYDPKLDPSMKHHDTGFDWEKAVLDYWPVAAIVLVAIFLFRK